MSANFSALVEAVVSASSSRRWSDAKQEWEVVGVERDRAGQGVCVCGQPNLVELFEIRNRATGQTLFPIGSTCINNFDQAEMDDSVDLLHQYVELKKRILQGHEVTLTSAHFSRRLLSDLYSEGAFPDDSHNSFNGERDLEFLLRMFNKRDKSLITAGQANKVSLLIKLKIIPFVKRDPRIG